MHHRIRPLLGHLAYTLYGAAIGIGSAVLWLRVLTPGRPLWIIGSGATACAVLLVAATAWARRARQPRSRSGRRAHARRAV